MLSDPANAPRLDGHTDFRRAVPTPDHFIPLLYLAGLAGVASDKQDKLDVLVDGCVYGSMSMTAYTLGLTGDGNTGGQVDAPPPAPDFPADASNI